RRLLRPHAPPGRRDRPGRHVVAAAARRRRAHGRRLDGAARAPPARPDRRLARLDSPRVRRRRLPGSERRRRRTNGPRPRCVRLATARPAARLRAAHADGPHRPTGEPPMTLAGVLTLAAGGVAGLLIL